MVNNIFKIKHYTPTLLWSNPLSIYNMLQHQPHFAGCQKSHPCMNSQKEMKLCRMINCGPECQKQAPGSNNVDRWKAVLPGHTKSWRTSHCFQHHHIYHPNKYHLLPSTASQKWIELIRYSVYATLTDILSVKFNRNKIQKQKLLVLCRLKEAYIKFKETHPDIATSSSEFSKLRLKWSIISEVHGTHTTCVYISSEQWNL
jgi:hypothetical protein